MRKSENFHKMHITKKSSSSSNPFQLKNSQISLNEKQPTKAYSNNNFLNYKNDVNKYQELIQNNSKEKVPERINESKRFDDPSFPISSINEYNSSYTLDELPSIVNSNQNEKNKIFKMKNVNSKSINNKLSPRYTDSNYISKRQKDYMNNPNKNNNYKYSKSYNINNHNDNLFLDGSKNLLNNYKSSNIIYNEREAHMNNNNSQKYNKIYSEVFEVEVENSVSESDDDNVKKENELEKDKYNNNIADSYPKNNINKKAFVNNNIINYNMNENKDNSDEESGNYGKSEDDDFENILKESIRQSQYNNENNNQFIVRKENPFNLNLKEKDKEDNKDNFNDKRKIIPGTINNINLNINKNGKKMKNNYEEINIGINSRKKNLENNINHIEKLKKDLDPEVNSNKINVLIYNNLIPEQKKNNIIIDNNICFQLENSNINNPNNKTLNNNLEISSLNSINFNPNCFKVNSNHLNNTLEICNLNSINLNPKPTIKNINNNFEITNLNSIQINNNKNNINNIKNKPVKRKKLDLQLNSNINGEENGQNKQNIISKEQNVNNMDENNNLNQQNMLVYPIKNLDLNNPEIKIQFINHNIANYNMLNNMNFFGRLKSISDERYSTFINEYQKDNYFMGKEQFENIFIDEKDINVKSPLTIIFHYIFNPKTLLDDSGKNFFETVYSKRGDQNYSMIYKESELNEVPKYFDDFNYINNLFNNFDEKELNSFLEDIKNWKKIFKYEQKFKYTIKHFKIVNNMNMKDVSRVYFVSPYDLIVDYHSYGSNFPMAEIFIAITQYRFHCDITFNKRKGKFEFKTSATVLNTIKLVKKTLLEKTIMSQYYSTNKKELENIWPNLKTVIGKEDKNNQEMNKKFFENHLKNNLNRYSKEKTEEFELFNNTEESEKNIINIENNNLLNLNNNINNINELNIIKNDEILNNFIEDSNHNVYINNETNNNILRGPKDKEKKKEEKNKNNKKVNKDKKILKYGVIFIFLLFIIKIVRFILRGNISLETLFYILSIIIIGLILIGLNIFK